YSTVLLSLFACGHFDPNTVIAAIDGDPIKASELQQAIRREKEKYPSERLNSSSGFLQIKRAALQDLIDRTLLLREATAQGTFISEAEFQNELRKYKSQYTELTFQKMLAERGVSNEQWLRLRREGFIVSKFLSNTSPEDRAATPESVQKYYNEHQDEFKVPESVHVRQIVTDTK